MTDTDSRNPEIGRLLEQLQQRFGSGVFVAQASADPNVIGFTSSADRRPYFSVVVTDLLPGRYSVQVTLTGPECEQFLADVDGVRLTFACDIPVDREMDLDELLRVFEQYQRLPDRQPSDAANSDSAGAPSE